MAKYIGAQKILQEETIETGFVKLTLENTTHNELDGSETIVLSSRMYGALATDKPVSDPSEFRNMRRNAYDELIGNICVMLLKDNVMVEDLDYVWTSVALTLNKAEQKRINKSMGRTSDFACVYELKDELMKKK